MKLTLREQLPYISAEVGYENQEIAISDVLLDTGSERTVFSSDLLHTIGISPQPNDMLFAIRGVGGSEVVFEREVDFIKVGGEQINNFVVEVGGMDYGFDINGIIGMDFLRQAGAIIDLQNLQLTFSRE